MITDQKSGLDVATVAKQATSMRYVGFSRRFLPLVTDRRDGKILRVRPAGKK